MPLTPSFTVSQTSGEYDKIRDWWIYKLTSPLGRVYIGKTSNLKNRMIHYRCNLGKDKKTSIYSSIKKYGFIAHTLEIKEKFKGNLNDSNCREMFWIRTYMSNKCKYPLQNGLNLTDGSEGTIGYKPTKEDKKKIGEASKGNKYAKGQVRTQAQKDHLSKLNKGKKIPKEELAAHIERVIKSCGRPIIQYNKEGQEIKKFKTIAIAAREIGIPKLGICRNLSGKYKQSRGFIFKYIIP